MMHFQKESLSTVDLKDKVSLPISILKNDSQESPSRNNIEPSNLSTFQRILLTTNGTVTDILEYYASEQIRVVKLFEQLVSLAHDIPTMELKEGTEVLVRKILLQGKISRKNFLYGDSIIVPEKLDEKFRKALLETKMPIGKLWFELRVETFKEILDTSKELAENLAEYFHIQPHDNMLSRTYRVINNRKPIMMITEKFPENYYLESF
ncbi:chorismate pyruvate-lyase family protein [Pelatocladus sp. BLCC-F211]|uniref:chorismate--pyruvate lyase family protein n=1 Tax=Pelatocladus sp. BLCC-F211 TaxID=3342752 RepID=UPI0035B7C557